MKRFIFALLALSIPACFASSPSVDAGDAGHASAPEASSTVQDSAPAQDGAGPVSGGHHLGAYMPGVATLPINLGGGSGSVTGVLPTGNQAAQSMSGDVTGTTASNTVVSITGSAGQVTVSPTNVTWAGATSAPALNQAATASSTGQTMHIAPQQSTQGTTETGGNLSVDLQTPLGGGGNEAAMEVTRGGTPYWYLQALPGNSSYSALFGNGVTVGTNTYALAATPSSVLLNAPSASGSVTLGLANTSYASLTTSAFNVYSGAAIFNPWQGSANTQTEQNQTVSAVMRTTTQSLTTFYSFSLAQHHGATVIFTAAGRTVVAGGAPWNTVDVVNSGMYRADFYNTSGSAVVNASGNIYIGASGYVGVSVSGTTVNLQAGGVPVSGGSNPTIDWQCSASVILD